MTLFPTVGTCTYYDTWLRGLKPEVRAALGLSIPPEKFLINLSIPPNLLTRQEARFVQFLLCGFDESPNASSNDSANQRLTDFVSTCMQDPGFRKSTERACEHFTQTVFPKITDPELVPWMTKMNTVIRIFLAKDSAELAAFAGFLQVLRNNDVAQGCARYSDYVIDRSKFMGGTVFALDAAVDRFTKESPSFGIALKDKIQKYLQASPELQAAFTTWQAQLPPAARS